MLDGLRAANVALRWLMLHGTGRHPRLGPVRAPLAPKPFHLSQEIPIKLGSDRPTLPH